MPENFRNRPTPNSLVGGFIRTKHNDSPMPLQVEAPRADELTRPDLDAAAARYSESPVRKGGWPKGRSRRTKLAVLGIPAGTLDAGDPAYARCVRLASAYRKARVRELAVVHEYVSTGASALLATAAMALAASRYLYEKAAIGGLENLDILKTASRMADSARQNELAAWELCARESIAKRKASQNNSGVPWIVATDDDSGYAKQKPGPKRGLSQRDQEVQLLALPPVGTPLDGWVRTAKIGVEVTDNAGSIGNGEGARSAGHPRSGGEVTVPSGGTDGTNPEIGAEVPAYR